jgi:flagellar biosynthesis chaperone FliJ
LNEELRKRLLEDAHERLQEFGEQIAAGAAEVQTAGTLRNLGLTVTDAADRLEAASTSHEEAREKVLEEEGHYREARKDRRVLEKLRERRRKLWDQELSREEQKDVDSQARHLRRAGEKG